MKGKGLMKEKKSYKTLSSNIIGKICIIVSIVLLILSLASCGGEKTALSADEFQSQMTAAGYNVVDASDQYPEGAVEAVLLALSEDGNYKIEFFVVPTESQAISAFNDNKNTFEQEKSGGASYSSVSASNYSKYTQNANDKYYVISRIGNTFIYIVTENANKEAVNNTLKALNY